MKGLHVLLVEDDTEVREAVFFLLQLEGATVTAVEAGRPALAIAGREDFDVLIADMGLPDLPGDVVVEGVLARSRRRPCVVVITAYGAAVHGAATAAGADVILGKPFEWSVLRAAVTERAVRADRHAA